MPPKPKEPNKNPHKSKEAYAQKPQFSPLPKLSWYQEVQEEEARINNPQYNQDIVLQNQFHPFLQYEPTKSNPIIDSLIKQTQTFGMTTSLANSDKNKNSVAEKSLCQSVDVTHPTLSSLINSPNIFYEYKSKYILKENARINICPLEPDFISKDPNYTSQMLFAQGFQFPTINFYKNQEYYKFI